MKNSFKPISKKCSTPESSASRSLVRSDRRRHCSEAGIAVAVVAAVIAAAFLSPPVTHGAIPQEPKTAKVSIESILRQDLLELRNEKRTDFRAVIERWDSVYGKASAPALKKIALDSKAPETDRYVAILAHTRVASLETGPILDRALTEKSWMLRSAALKSIEILALRESAPKVLSLLEKDPALVIRSQAIDTLARLRPEGLGDALIRAAMDSKNYRPADFRKGRADWIPQKALETLRELRPQGLSAKLLPLMNDAKDGRVRAQALHTIETLEKRSLARGKPFAERALAWNRELKPAL